MVESLQSKEHSDNNMWTREAEMWQKGGKCTKTRS